MPENVLGNLPNKPLEGRKKLAELKARIFDPGTKKERVERALTLLSAIKPIEGIDKATWESITTDLC